LRDDLAALRDWLGDAFGQFDRTVHVHTLEADHDGFVTLAHPKNQTRLANLIQQLKPDVVCFDPLGYFGIGNIDKDEDMWATLHAINRLVKRGNPQRATIVLHHAGTGKAGSAKAIGFDRSSFGRNSKVLHAWTRAQINIAPGSRDSNETLVVACGKCSNGREFPEFACRLNPKTMIYEVDESFDLTAWKSEIGATKGDGPKVTIERVYDLCRGAMKKPALVKALMDDTGCGRSLAYRKVDQAEKSRKIAFNRISGTYVQR